MKSRRIRGVNLQKIRGQKFEIRRAASHCSDIVVLQGAARNQQEWVAVLSVLRTRNVVESHEPALAAQESIRVDGRGPGMASGGARPLQTVRLEPGISYAAEEARSDSRNFVHYIRGR